MKGVIATSRVWIVSAIALGFWSEKENKQETKSLKTFNSRQPWGKLQGQDLFESTTTRFPRQNMFWSEWRSTETLFGFKS